MLNGIACMLSRYTALYKDTSLGSTGTGRPLLVSDAGQMTEGSAGRPPPPTRFLQLVCFLSLLLLFILRIVAIIISTVLLLLLLFDCPSSLSSSSALSSPFSSSRAPPSSSYPTTFCPFLPYFALSTSPSYSSSHPLLLFALFVRTLLLSSASALSSSLSY
jgi:hypothetical protein